MNTGVPLPALPTGIPKVHAENLLRTVTRGARLVYKAYRINITMLDSNPGVADLSFHNVSSHGSPLFDFLTAFAPRRLKDLFKLCEYLYFNSSQIYAALQKFAIYPVTEINYTSTNESLKKKYKHLHERVLKTKRTLIRGAIDKYVYGNAFFSVYSPFVRFLKCEKCDHLTNIQAVEYKFRLKKLEFLYKCSSCKHKGPGTVIDRKITRPDKIAIIRWDPKLMDIDHNPITGHSEYFYSIPRDLKEKVQKGNKHLINTLPMEFLRALRDEKIFKFSDGQLFHIKMDAPAGIEAQWGFPPLASTIKLFFYAAVLRKANEAIALDYVVPFRIISPRQSSSNADPVLTISLNRWSEEMKQNVRKWRRDPLHIMWSAVPAEVTHVGGQARALMTLGEVQAAEENIITALGIPKEFIIGGLSFTGAASTCASSRTSCSPRRVTSSIFYSGSPTRSADSWAGSRSRRHWRPSSSSTTCSRSSSCSSTSPTRRAGRRSPRPRWASRSISTPSRNERGESRRCSTTPG